MFERIERSARMGAIRGELRDLYERAMRTYAAHRLIVLGLSLIGVTAFVARSLAILRYPAPPGADYGNYLTNLHAFLGDDVTGDGLGYPTVFLAYLWAVTSAFGELRGLQLSGPLLAAAFAVPAFYLLRAYVGELLAVVGAGILAYSEGLSELIGWGGNPTLLGLIFGTFFLGFFIRWTQGASWRHLLGAALSFGLLAGSHQISLVFFGVTALLAVALLAMRRGTRRLASRGLAAVAAGIASSTPFIPFYLRANEASSYLWPARAFLVTLDDFVFVIGWLFREALAVWIFLFVLAILGFSQARKTRGPGFAVGLALLVCPFLLATTLMALHPVRPLYYLPVGIVVGALLFVQDFEETPAAARSRPDPRINRATVAAAVVLALSVVLVTTAHHRTAQAVDWYIVMRSEVLDGLGWIRENAPRDAGIATSGPARYGSEELVGCTWGWWIEGYASRRSLCTAELQALAWQDQVRRSADANRAFMGPVSVENGLVLVGDYAPYGSRGNPIVSGEFGRGYEALIYFNDARVRASWTPEDGGGQQTVTLYDLASREASIEATSDHVRLETVGTSASLSILRETDVDRGLGTVWVSYTFRAPGDFDEIVVSVFGTSRSRLNNFDGATHALSVGSLPGLREEERGRVRIVSGGETLIGITAKTNPDALAEFEFRFDPDGPAFSLGFAVDVLFDRNAVPTPVRVYHALSLLGSYGVGYVLIDKARVREMEWFTNDRDHFQTAYQNFGVALFEVVA